MCTLIVLDRIAPAYPLVVASNRDEFYSRPAAPPARVDPQEETDPPFVAPQDMEAGGTWMGLNARGLFVGLTNRPVQTADRQRRSRGLLVHDALRAQGVAGVPEVLGDDLALRYNPFHLLAADGRDATLTVVDGEGVRIRRLEPGRHVVCNRDPEDPSSRKVAWIQEAVDRLSVEQPIERVFAGLAEILAAHPNDSNSFENPCVHTPEYGTRSASVLAIGESRWRFWHAEGAPCEAKFSNLTRLLDELRQAIPRSSHATQGRLH